MRASAVLRPGVVGWQVDAAARASLVAASFPEPMYALGHQLGRTAHDGGTVLAPRWDRYGTAPFGVVEEGNVFTVEYGTAVPGRGYIGLEEDVLVTSDGVEWLSNAAARALARRLAGVSRSRRSPPPSTRLSDDESAHDTAATVGPLDRVQDARALTRADESAETATQRLPFTDGSAWRESRALRTASRSG